MKENYFQKKIREKVKKVGGLALKLYPFSFAGLPDLMVLMPGGRIWFVEVKRPASKTNGRSIKKGTLSEHQNIWFGILRKLGFDCWCVDSNEILDYFLMTITNKE